MKEIKRIKDVPEDMIKRIHSMADQTWNAIGSDCLVDECGKPDYSKSLPRSHVIEIVMDADFMRTYGQDIKAYEFFNTLSYNLKKRIIKDAFPYKSYGY